MMNPATLLPLPSRSVSRSAAWIFGLLVSTAAWAQAVEVEFRLVPHHDVEETVDSLERSQPVVNAVSTDQGVRMDTIGVDVTSWARNVLLDGKPLFERYHKGKYVDRLAVAKASLDPGSHTIWPGDHEFTVAEDGSITTADPSLVVEGALIRIKAYPVTVRGMPADDPVGSQAAPLPSLTIRDATDALTDVPPGAPIRSGSKELLPSFERFAPLTIWMPANSQGRGYLLHPLGLSFHLGEEGVDTSAGDGDSVPGVRVEANTIHVPIHAYGVTGEPGSKLVVSGVQQFTWNRHSKLANLGAEWHDAVERQLTAWYPRTTPYELRLSEVGPALEVAGDLSVLPVKALRVEIADPVTGAQRLAVAELAERHVQPGQTLRARVRAIDLSTLTVAQREMERVRGQAVEAEAELKAAAHLVSESKKAVKAADEADLPAAEAALAQVTSAHAEAQSVIEQRKAALDVAVQGRDALATTNDAADWAPYARLQAVAGETWTELAVTPVDGTDGEVDLTLPAGLESGAYRLELGAAGDTVSQGLAAELWISVAEEDGTGIGIFTQRGRSTFLRGEDFWIAVAATGDIDSLDGRLDLALVDAAGERWPLLPHGESTTAGAQRTVIVRIPAAVSSALAAGSYRVEAAFAGQQARALTLVLVDAAPKTHFTNLLPGKYSSTGHAYTATLRHGRGAERLAKDLADIGMNAFMGMSYPLDRLSHPNQELERLVRERSQLGPWESYYQPSGRERFMDAALRNGLRFYENMFTYHDTQLPREANFFAASERYVSLETASMRSHPAFRGVCLYDEFYWYHPAGIPPNVEQAIEAAEEVAYREAFPGMTATKAARALDRFFGMPPGRRDRRNLEDGISRDLFRDRAWGDFSRRMSTAVKRVMPESNNFTLQRFWGGNGGNLAPNGTPMDVSDPLDIAVPIMYKDGGVGDRPVFAPMQADVLRTRPEQTVWTQIFGSTPALNADAVLRQTLFGLSQKVEGLSMFWFGGINPGSKSYLDGRDTLRNVTAMTTRYGDFLMSLQRGYQQVGILYSRRADLLASSKPEKIPHTCEGLWVACMRAGFPADFLYDESLLAGDGDRYQVIFAPGFTVEQEITPELRAALKRLIDAGKTVIVERGSKLDLDGLVRIDSDLNEYDDKLGGAFPQYIDFEFETVFKRSEQTTALVRELLPKYILPAAEHELLVGPDWLTRGQGQYMVLANFAPTGFTGSHKTLYQAPSVAQLRFPKRPPACYDVLQMKRLEPTVDGDWMSLDIDMRRYPGAITAFLPAPIAGVGVQAPARIVAGSALPYAVTVDDTSGTAIDAAFPVEIRLLDPSGIAVHEVYRSAAPRLNESYPIGVNSAVGTWILEVRELISGTLSRASIEVTAGTLPAAELDTRQVWIAEPAQVSGFLEQSDEIVIALAASQDWVRPQAERLRDALAQRGHTVRIASPTELIRLPGEWETGPIDGTRLWRGEVVQPGLFVDHQLIVLGSRDENRLIEALLRRDVLPQPLSDNFPGAGRGLIDVTFRAFSNAHDTLSLLSIDPSGLAACVDALLAELPTGTAESTPAALEPAAPLAAVSQLDPRPEAPPATLAALDWVRAMDTDPASGRVVVSTQGYGHNLFCFDAEGALLWKQFLPEHGVYFAGWCDDGRKIVAATSRGFYLFVLDASDGTVLGRCAASEWPKLHYSEGPIASEQRIIINHHLDQILVAGSTGVMALDYACRPLWFRDRADAIAEYSQESEQSEAAEFSHSLAVGDIALSPDGLQLVHGEYEVVGTTVQNKTLLPIWAFRPMILDARSGETLAVNRDDAGLKTKPSGWSVSWPADASDPLVHVGGLVAVLRHDGSLGPMVPDRGWSIAGDGILERDAAGVTAYDASGSIRWSASKAAGLPELDVMSHDAALLYRCDAQGGLTAIDLDDGTTRWTHRLPAAARLRPTHDGLVCGDKSGRVVHLSAAGREIWRTRLGNLHEQPTSDYAGYIRSAIERDQAVAPAFPVAVDGPDDFDGVFRLGTDQLVDGGFESETAWVPGDTASPLVYVSTASDGERALELAEDQLVTQELARRVIPTGTYLLEFRYRVESPDAFLTAGAEIVDSGKPSFTGSRFKATPGEWAFGRLAVKTLLRPETMVVGFEASGGRILVDQVRLRAVRFPSSNLLSSPDLTVIEPTFVADPRIKYERLPGDLRSKLMQRNHVAAYKQGLAKAATLFVQEQAFLHNGRLDDLGQMWLYSPDALGYSVVLTKPAWISHLVLYLNNATPENTYQTIAVLANDLETSMPHNVALVRGNQRRFVVLHFEQPVHTDSLKILPRHPSHQECLTEVELYGSLVDPQQEAEAEVDDAAVPMFMGTPARVPATLPDDMVGNYAEVTRQRTDPPAFHVDLTVIDGRIAVGDARGSLASWTIPAADDKRQRFGRGPAWSLQTVTPTTTPARAAGRLLVGSADHRLHAVADDGTYLWGFGTGGRIRSSPLVVGDDVYVGSDDHRLYKIDLRSGAMIWEYATAGAVRGAPVLAGGLVCVTSADGSLHAIDADTGLGAWTSAIAEWTRSTPAVVDGTIVVGDEAGDLQCFDAGSGEQRWNHPLGHRFSGCPVVTPEGTVFVAEDGTMALVAPDGTLAWTRSLDVLVSGQAIATQSQLLVPTTAGLRVVLRADGSNDDRFVPPEGEQGQVLSVLGYRGDLLLAIGGASTNYRYPPRTYADYHSALVLWRRVDEPSPEEATP